MWCCSQKLARVAGTRFNFGLMHIAPLCCVYINTFALSSLLSGNNGNDTSTPVPISLRALGGGDKSIHPKDIEQARQPAKELGTP